MKLAFLLQCHKNPFQINTLIKTLNHPDIDFYVHIDKKSNIRQSIDLSGGNVYILPDEYRVDVRWATFSQVEAAISLLKYASLNGKYDFYFKQDFMHRIIRRGWVEITGGYGKIYSIFKKKNIEGIKYYYGSCGWYLSGEFVEYCLAYLDEKPEFYESYKKTSCPDESFFQTLLMNSKYAGTRKDYLHYIDWSEGKSSPKILVCDDFDKIFSSGKLMARKFDIDVDPKIIEKIQNKIS